MLGEYDQFFGEGAKKIMQILYCLIQLDLFVYIYQFSSLGIEIPLEQYTGSLTSNWKQI